MMTRTIPLTLTIAISGLLAAPSYAASLQLKVEIPTLNVAEYHRPYIAVYVEGPDGKVPANLALWYQNKDTKEGHGTKWLPDLRQWWRKSGRSLELPIDGVTGPTRPAGLHTLDFAANAPQLAGLKPGSYTLVVEAAREVGGRELVKLPFTWPVAASQTANGKGSSEIGTVALIAKP